MQPDPGRERRTQPESNSTIAQAAEHSQAVVQKILDGLLEQHQRLTTVGLDGRIPPDLIHKLIAIIAENNRLISLAYLPVPGRRSL